ncbi:MAG: hypothetical protein ACJASX_003906 [Limisphaerales bacterium]
MQLIRIPHVAEFAKIPTPVAMAVGRFCIFRYSHHSSAPIPVPDKTTDWLHPWNRRSILPLHRLNPQITPMAIFANIRHA